jgi:sulfite reductase beta subunit-like hemoprotein
VNKTEQIKQEKNGLDVWDDIFRYAEEGFEAITEDDFARMRWYGIYQQRPNNGHFMMRVKIPGGQLSADQVDALAEITEKYSRGFCDITTRQDIQYHWLTIQTLPKVLHLLESVGLTTKEACGDVPRNTTGCPLHGVNADELIDGSDLVRTITDRLMDDRAFSDLPRKYKVCVSGCGTHCSRPEINDLAFLAVRHPDTGEVGFNVWVGGGLSTQPKFAKSIDAWVTPDEVLPLAVAVTEIFRDDGYRVSRMRARLKFVMEDWGPEKFRDVLQAKLDFPLKRAVPGDYVDDYEDHMGIRPQKQPGLFSLGAVVTVGRITGEQLRVTAEVSRRYGQGRVRTALTQNLIVLDVPSEDVAEAAGTLQAAGLAVTANDVQRGAATCTGIEFCNLAVAETKNIMKDTVEYLSANTNFEGPFRMHMNGCPNSCGQHHIADIGFMGGRVKIDGVQHECFDISVGGGVGEGRAVVHTIKRKILADDVKTCVKNLMDAYMERRDKGESFRSFIRRHPDEELVAFLGGREIPATAEFV